MEPYVVDDALRHLRATDARWGAVIERVGPPALIGVRRRAASPFTSLARAIVFQQLSTRAAATIYGRLREQLAVDEPDAALRPESVAALEAGAFRAAGVSRAKERALRDLAAHVLAGGAATWDDLAAYSDEAIVARFTDVWGIGVWTVQMLLLFDLGRPDVLPTADLGVRRGAAVFLGLDAPPAPAALVRHAEPWRPYRSVASWYLWRVGEE